MSWVSGEYFVYAAEPKADNSFEAYVATTSGSNVLSIVARDFSGNNSTNRYSVTVTNDVGTEVLTYDDNGNQTSVSNTLGVVTYQWDVADRLVKISKGNDLSLFTYDGLGRRVQIVETNTGTHAT